MPSPRSTRRSLDEHEFAYDFPQYTYPHDKVASLMPPAPPSSFAHHAQSHSAYAYAHRARGPSFASTSSASTASSGASPSTPPQQRGVHAYTHTLGAARRPYWERGTEDEEDEDEDDEEFGYGYGNKRSPFADEDIYRERQSRPRISLDISSTPSPRNSPRTRSRPLSASHSVSSHSHSHELDASPLRTALLLNPDPTPSYSPYTPSPASDSPRFHTRGLGLGSGMGIESTPSPSPSHTRALALSRRRAEWTEFPGDAFSASGHASVEDDGAIDLGERCDSRPQVRLVDDGPDFGETKEREAGEQGDDVPRCFSMKWSVRARWAALKLRVRIGAFRARRRVGLA